MSKIMTAATVGKFNLFYPLNCEDLVVRFESPPDYYGITFHQDKYRIEVIECLLGTRLIINGREGEVRDMPFHEGTFRFLPEYVKAERIT